MKLISNCLKFWLFLILLFNATLTAKIISWSVMHVSWLSNISTNTTFFPKPPTIFLTCFRGERPNYARAKVCLNPVSNSQPPGHESGSPLSQLGRSLNGKSFKVHIPVPVFFFFFQRYIMVLFTSVIHSMNFFSGQSVERNFRRPVGLHKWCEERSRSSDRRSSSYMMTFKYSLKSTTTFFYILCSGFVLRSTDMSDSNSWNTKETMCPEKFILFVICNKNSMQRSRPSHVNLDNFWCPWGKGLLKILWEKEKYY